MDPRNGSIYVVDKTARIQHFTADGEFINEWSMPEGQLGRPVGISVAPDGRVFVPDTHYHRILVFDEQGNELNRFGRFGTGPGEFVYPTDVVFGPEGELYVSEYGTNDTKQSQHFEFLDLKCDTCQFLGVLLLDKDPLSHLD